MVFVAQAACAHHRSRGERAAPRISWLIAVATLGTAAFGFAAPLNVCAEQTAAVDKDTQDTSDPQDDAGYVVVDGHGSPRYLDAPSKGDRARRMTGGPTTSKTTLAPAGPGAAGRASLAQYTVPEEEGPVFSESGTPEIVEGNCEWYGPPPTRHYVSLDALGWWVKRDHLPPLVTTSPLGTPQTLAGVLGVPTTTILFGNQGVNDGIRPGGRVQGGIWLDDFQSFAVEGNYFGLATESTTYSITSVFTTGELVDPILARPYYDIAPAVDRQSSVIVAFPDFVFPPTVVDIDGTIEVSESSRVQSAGGGGRLSLSDYTSAARLYLLGAYRFFELDESLSIVASSTPGTNQFPIPVPDGRVQAVDQFSTQNVFHGGEIGLAAELARTRWTLGAETRLAMGNMHQTVAIDGLTSAISGPFTASFEGGLLAQPSNMGTFTRNRFALIPQLDLKLGYQVLPSMRLTVGYNLIWVTQVVRPGDQVDLTVNTTQIAGLPLIGPARPELPWNDTSIWLQGVTAGLDFRF